MPFPLFRMEDVDDGEVERFRKPAGKRRCIDPHLLDEPKEVLLRKLPLVNNGYLTNAAILLFAKDPQDFQQGAYIKVGYFENDADLLYQDEIHGSLLEQVDKAIEVIDLKYLRAKISYEGIQRIERYFVPEAALLVELTSIISVTSSIFFALLQSSLPERSHRDPSVRANCKSWIFWPYDQFA